ncbi:sensor histidine kinase [Nocardia pneumoniae]|uniref:sensor histidine kinase n=1 Tax=Nocardia pneumoniae TaxID=228601 RepID=UPI0002E5D9D6|nr:HAMP domain-containing sensor histidine kinase [Nocardia pneumoniae]
MRRRLLVILLIFAALAVFGFAVPLSASSSTGRTQQLWFDRYVDAEWFSELSEEAMATGNRQTLVLEMQRYHNLYSDQVLVVDAAGTEFANTGVDVEDPAVVQLLFDVRSNRHSVQPPRRLRTWDPDTMRVAHPIGAGMQIQGAVLIEASTVRAKRDIADRWALIALGAWTALALFTGVALGLSRWVLRPLAKLSDSVAVLTETLPMTVTQARPTSATQRYEGPPEVKDLARSFDTMALAVGDAVDAQRQLVADTAHAIRNPLAALAIRLESLGRVIPDQAQESFRRASSQIDRLKAVLDGLLRLAVAETPAGFGAAHADSDWPSRCDAARVVEDRVDAWLPAYEEAGMTVAAVMPMEEAEVAIPEDALVQILDVLLSNSCRYAGTGARTEVRVDAGVRWVTVSVVDDGVGVTVDELDKLTTRFYRGTSAAAGGSGLGLPIASALAQRYHGELTVGATVPNGLHISVRLPVRRSDR